MIATASAFFRCKAIKPDILHAHSPVLDALPALGLERVCNSVVTKCAHSGRMLLSITARRPNTAFAARWLMRSRRGRSSMPMP